MTTKTMSTTATTSTRIRRRPTNTFSSSSSSSSSRRMLLLPMQGLLLLQLLSCLFLVLAPFQSCVLAQRGHDRYGTSFRHADGTMREEDDNEPEDEDEEEREEEVVVVPHKKSVKRDEENVENEVHDRYQNYYHNNAAKEENDEDVINEEDEEDSEDEEEEDDNDYHQLEVSGLWQHFDCDEVFDQRRPIHSQEDWIAMRQAYLDTVFDGVDFTENGDFLKGHGFAVPVQAQPAGQKGRGVFTTAPVKAGQLVWSTAKTARFNSGPSYREFLANIRPDVACDVLQWAYVQDLSNADSQTDQTYISVDLDAGSFINTVNYDEGEEPNVGCHQEASQEFEDRGGCQQNYFALKDIAVGQELLLDYGDFAIPDGWEWFGL